MITIICHDRQAVAEELAGEGSIQLGDAFRGALSDYVPAGNHNLIKARQTHINVREVVFF